MTGKGSVALNLIERMKRATPTRERALLLLNEAVEKGRFRMLTKVEESEMRKNGNGKLPLGSLRYEGLWYVPIITGDFQQRLGAKFRAFLHDVRMNDFRKTKAEISEALRKGNNNLNHLRDGRLGTYAVLLPKKVRDGDLVLFPGVAVLSVKGKRLSSGLMINIIEVVSGVGKFTWLNEFAGQWISVTSFQQDKSDTHLSGTLLAFSDRLIAALRVAYKAQRHAQR